MEILYFTKFDSEDYKLDELHVRMQVMNNITLR
jgi:hypothetical protein